MSAERECGVMGRHHQIHARCLLRRNFPFVWEWRGRPYTTKQVEAYAVEEGNTWLVITVVVKYFGERETH